MPNLSALRVAGDAKDPLLKRAFPGGERADDLSGWGFALDRRRVIGSRAFRRLAGKTQVFTSRASDHFRSRLTHTIEVVETAREVARALGLNESLAETLALVHDIGHPPFGHAGERALDECLKGYGQRFDHNLHALRIVEHFEDRFAAHRGLNLTLGVREGIIKHSRDYAASDHPALSAYFLGERPPIEAQIIDLADEIAYLTADLDDGVESSLLTVPHIREHVPVLARAFAAVEQKHPGTEEKFLFHEALQRMERELVEDLIANTAAEVSRGGLRSLEDVRHHGSRVAVFSTAMEQERLRAKRYLYDHLYLTDELEREHRKAEDVVAFLFGWYCEKPERLPASYQAEIAETGLPRVIADYLAGMTDSFILQQFWAARR